MKVTSIAVAIALSACEGVVPDPCVSDPDPLVNTFCTVETTGANGWCIKDICFPQCTGSGGGCVFDSVQWHKNMSPGGGCFCSLFAPVEL